MSATTMPSLQETLDYVLEVAFVLHGTDANGSGPVQYVDVKSPPRVGEMWTFHEPCEETFKGSWLIGCVSYSVKDDRIVDTTAILIPIPKGNMFTAI